MSMKSKSIRAVLAATCLLVMNGIVSVAGATTSPTCFGKSPTISGTTGDDVINGTSHADVIIGKDGADIIHGNGGADLICGSDGVDTLYGDAGNDKLSGDNHQDVLNGGSGADILEGGGQYYAGAPGGDAVSYADSSVGVDVNLLTGTGGPIGQAQDTITGVWTIIGSAHDDTLIGGSDGCCHGNRILGGDGNDTITGNDGDEGDYLDGEAGNDQIDAKAEQDFVSGGPGNDTLNAGDGSDTVAGGPGDDVLDSGGDTDASGWGDIVSFQDAAGPVQVNLATSQVSGEGADSISAGFAGVIGSPFADQIAGDSGPNFIRGAEGSDLIHGRQGKDFLVGGLLCAGAAQSCPDGNDTIYGGHGNDHLFDNNFDLGWCDSRCPNDRDTLFGGSGHDVVTAEFGNDTIHIKDGVSGNDRADGGKGTDTCYHDVGDTVLHCP
jgi:Ca2+-binding RTX toxin-like protein